MLNRVLVNYALLVIYFLETFYDENQNVTLGDSANKINAKVGLVKHFKGKLKLSLEQHLRTVLLPCLQHPSILMIFMS